MAGKRDELKDSAIFVGGLVVVSDALSPISMLEVKLVGNAFTTELESRLFDSLRNDCYPVRVNGQFSPACGVDLGYDIVVFVCQSIAGGLIFDLVKNVFSRVERALTKTVPGSALFRTRIKLPDYELVIAANPNAGTCSEGICLEELISNMTNFAQAESLAGAHVQSIEAPCDLRFSERGLDYSCHGVGNYSLWRVIYKDGPRWPEAVYDAVNESFVSTEINGDVKLPRDVYYSALASS